MSTLTPSIHLTPLDVERAGERDGKLYELIDDKLKEKEVGFKSLFIAGQILARLNACLYPHEGAAASEVMIYCFLKKRQGRKPDVVYIKLDRLPNREVPEGDLFIAPDLVVEVLSPGNSGIEVDDKLDEYLAAGVPLVWIVNPDRRTVRVYDGDGTMRIFRAGDTIKDEPRLPGFSLNVSETFPVPASPAAQPG